MAAHDAWTRATLSEFFEACRTTGLGDDAFRHWLEDRAVLAARLSVAVRRCLRLGGGVPAAAVAVVDEDAIRLDSLVAWFGPAGGGGVVPPAPGSAAAGPDGRMAAAAAAASAMATATILPPPPPASRLSYAGKRLMDLIDAATSTSDTPACLGATAIWALLLASWQGWHLTRNRAESEAAGAAKSASGAAGGGRGRGGRRAAARVGGAGTSSRDALRPGTPAAAAAAADPGLSLAAGGGGIGGDGLNARSRALANVFVREEVLEGAMELQTVVERALAEASESGVVEAQRVFEQVLERLDRTYEQALTVNVSAVKSICDKCGRAGHGGDRCTFQSHV